MQPGYRLHPHQVIGVDRIVTAAKDGRLRGHLIADDVGFGKSAEAISFLLHQRNLKAFAVPTLTVVPSHVVLQWAEEIQTITREFHIHLYYGSTAKAKGKDQYDIIEGGNLNIVAL